MTLYNDKYFEANLKAWEKAEPEAARVIRERICSNVFICENENLELNLKMRVNDVDYYFYSQDSIEKEAEEWFEECHPRDAHILLIYGIGLGHYYKAALKWLKENPANLLVFIEDDLDVLHRFFETAIASKIIADPQVRVHALAVTSEADALIVLLTTVLMDVPYKISAWRFYKKHRPVKCLELENAISQGRYIKYAMFNEVLQYGFVYFKNFYQGLSNLPYSYLANRMAGQFKGVPAIICAAGPSLDRNIEQLKGLQDKALIFAGGTAMNAMNSRKINPHFGASIDPNITQITRVLANNAFEIPYFYRLRTSADAMEIVHGDHLYINGAGGYKLPSWLEKRCEIESSVRVEEGMNVINFCTSIAQILGCNPIIFVGLDLAYTNKQSYVSNMAFHPFHHDQDGLITKSLDDELIEWKDIYDQPIFTLWKWISESKWYTEYAARFPDKKFINATEGGIGFKGGVNMSLAEASEQFLTKHYDFDSLIHITVQNVPMEKTVTHQSLDETVDTLKASMEKCHELLSQVINNYLLVIRASTVSSTGYQDESIKEEVTNLFEKLDEIENLKKELEQEEAYQAILKPFGVQYTFAIDLRKRYMNLHQVGNAQWEEEEKRKVQFETVLFFRDACTAHLRVIQENERKPVDEKNRPQNTFFKSDQEILKKSPSKEVPEQGENRLDCHLDGLSEVFNEKGGLLVKSQYVNGLKEGKAFYYYHTGDLYAVKQFKKGIFDGEQHHYYADGTLKSRRVYDNGLLDQTVFLYYPLGQLKREIHFSKGLRDGTEKLWAESGQLLIEANYRQNVPSGKAQHWNLKGALVQSMTYDETGKQAELRRWDSSGNEVSQEAITEKDYFDSLVNQSETLTKALFEVFNRVEMLAKYLTGIQHEEAAPLALHVAAIEKQVSTMIEMNKNIQNELKSAEGQEPFWKSATLKKELLANMEGLIVSMSTDMVKIDEAVVLILKVLNEGKPEG